MQENQNQDADDRAGGDFRIPLPRYTVAIIGCITAVFAAQLWVDPPHGGSAIEILFYEFINPARAAGLVKSSFLYGGEYWRLLTGSLLHGFIVHYAMNCYAFYGFGKLFELLTNRAHLPIVFLASALAGGLMSSFLLPVGVSVGASGGIVGLISYLLVYAFRRRRFVSRQFRKTLLINIGFILAFGLVLYSFVDNWGHIGGLIAGAVYGLIQIPGDPHTDPREAGHITKILGFAAFVICVGGAVLSIYLIFFPFTMPELGLL